MCYNITMFVIVRRVGNSLGVIIPKGILKNWGVGEGDHLVVTDRDIRPPRLTRMTAQERLEEHKRKLAAAVVSGFGAREIRARILANLHRWKRQGAWVSAYDEWKALAEGKDDGALFAAMLGRDERSTRLRDSAPYVGLLPREEVRKLNEEAAG
jgi:antitoxin component of MazEF toxin-antitoxin module